MVKISKTRLVAYIFLILNTALWGFSSPIIKYSFDFTSPTTFLLYRFLIATLIFFPFYFIYLKKHRQKINFKLIFLLSLLGTPLTLLPLFYGLSLTSSFEASVLVSTSPILTIIGGLIFLKETIKPREWLGLSIAILGTLLLTIDPILSRSSVFSHFSIFGNLLIILSNLFWTCFLLIAKKYRSDPVTVSFFSYLFAIPFFLITSIITSTGLSVQTLAWPGIIFMSIGGSIIGFWAYIEGQKRIEASEAAMFTYLQPLFALPLALVWLKEPISPLSIFSLITILVGVFIA